MQNTLVEKVLSKDKWLRALLMLFFILIRYVVVWLITAILIFQFVVNLFFGKPNTRVLEFSKRLNLYLLQVVSFLTFNSDTKPFPFADWPDNVRIEDYIK